MTKVTIGNENGIYTAEVDEIEMPMHDLLDKVVVPALMAAGYIEDVVWRHIDTTKDGFSKISLVE